MERLRAIKTQLATHNVDLEAMRRGSKAAWESPSDEDVL